MTEPAAALRAMRLKGIRAGEIEPDMSDPEERSARGASDMAEVERCARCRCQLDNFGRLEDAVTLDWKPGWFHRACAMYEQYEHQREEQGEEPDNAA